MEFMPQVYQLDLKLHDPARDYSLQPGGCRVLLTGFYSPSWASD